MAKEKKIVPVKCQTCGFWECSKEERVEVVSDKRVCVFFPATLDKNPQDWCGHWKYWEKVKKERSLIC